MTSLSKGIIVAARGKCTLVQDILPSSGAIVYVQSVIQFDAKHDIDGLSYNKVLVKKRLEHGKYYDVVIAESEQQGEPTQEPEQGRVFRDGDAD